MSEKIMSSRKLGCYFLVVFISVVYIIFCYDSYDIISGHKTKLNSVALVRERTIPTEQPLLVGKVGTNFCR
jgi:hypothetical protein